MKPIVFLIRFNLYLFNRTQRLIIVRLTFFISICNIFQFIIFLLLKLLIIVWMCFSILIKYFKYNIVTHIIITHLIMLLAILLLLKSYIIGNEFIPRFILNNMLISVNLYLFLHLFSPCNLI